ncbi:MAG: hypothetical protein AAF411_13455 [Myxococcota bacterium]
MHHSSKCPKVRRLIEHDGIVIDHCRCGTYHVHIGQVSLRLPAGGIRALREALNAVSGDKEALTSAAWAQA